MTGPPPDRAGLLPDLYSTSLDLKRVLSCMHFEISDAYGDFAEVSRARGGFTGVFRAKIGDVLAVILGNARYLRAPPSLGRADVKMNIGYH